MISSISYSFWSHCSCSCMMRSSFVSLLFPSFSSSLLTLLLSSISIILTTSVVNFYRIDHICLTTCWLRDPTSLFSKVRGFCLWTKFLLNQVAMEKSCSCCALEYGLKKLIPAVIWILGWYCYPQQFASNIKMFEQTWGPNTPFESLIDQVETCQEFAMDVTICTPHKSYTMPTT